MISNFLFSFVKVLFAFGAVLLAAALKWVREQNKLKIINEAIKFHIRIFPYQDRILYKTNTDKFMNKYHAQTIFFKKEIWVNGFRGLMGLLIWLVFSYYAIMPYLIFFILVLIAWVLSEMAMDIVKEKKWYQYSLVILWIIGFFAIACCENVKNNPEKPKYNSQDSLMIKP